MRFEEELLPPIRDRLEGLGYTVCVEFPANGKVADIVGIRKDGAVVTVELKLKKWRRALYQAFLHQAWADRVYVALPDKMEDLVCRNSQLFEEAGVGVYLVPDGTCGDVRLLIQARDSQWMSTLTRERVLATIGADR